MEIGIGIAGFGFIGKVHALAHRSLPLMYDPLPGSTRLISVCTSRAETAETARATAGFARFTTDYSELISAADIDAIHICTPNDVHCEQVLQAIRAGKHVYCDKPLALNVAEAERIVAAAQGARAALQVTFNYRFVPATMRARQLVEDGFLGDLLAFRAAYLHAGYVDPARPFSWRLDMARSGGGAIADLGSHVIDLLRFLVGPGTGVDCGGEIARLSASLQTLIKERRVAATGEMKPVDVDDVAYLTCELAGGALGTIEASRMATGVQDELRIELHGSRGAIRFNLMEPNWLDVYDNSIPEYALGGDRGMKRLECVTRYPKPYALGATKNTVGWLNFHIQSLYDFISNVARSRAGEPMAPHSPTLLDGLAVHRVIAAAQESNANCGAWMPVGGIG